MLGLFSMAIAKTYPESFSDKTGYLPVVLGSCQ
jgi:hypothetical protein